MVSFSRQKADLSASPLSQRGNGFRLATKARPMRTAKAAKSGCRPVKSGRRCSRVFECGGERFRNVNKPAVAVGGNFVRKRGVAGIAVSAVRPNGN